MERDQQVRIIRRPGKLWLAGIRRVKTEIVCELSQRPRRVRQPEITPHVGEDDPRPIVRPCRGDREAFARGEVGEVVGDGVGR